MANGMIDEFREKSFVPRGFNETFEGKLLTFFK